MARDPSCFPVSIWERSGQRDTRVKGCYIESETLPLINRHTTPKNAQGSDAREGQHAERPRAVYPRTPCPGDVCARCPDPRSVLDPLCVSRGQRCAAVLPLGGPNSEYWYYLMCLGFWPLLETA